MIETESQFPASFLDYSFLQLADNRHRIKDTDFAVEHDRTSFRDFLRGSKYSLFITDQGINLDE